MGPRRYRDDSGMTLIEVVVATMILFIGVTAVMGLMASSTQMSVMSKQGNITVNAVSSFIEEIRAMPYDQIGIAGGEPAGTLDASRTIGPVEGFVIQVSVDVEWVNDPDITGGQNYKRLTIAAVSDAPGARPYRYETETLIRNASDNRPDDATPPLVNFGSLTPNADAVVSGLVDIDWFAETPMENGRVTKVYLLGAGGFLRGVSGGVEVDGVWGAEWLVNDTSGSGIFRWDTTMMKLDENLLPTDEPLYPDGPFTVTVEAWDNLVQKSSRMRQFYIDNNNPQGVESVTGTPVTATIARIDWPHAIDGAAYANSYRVRFLRQLAGQDQMQTYSWQDIEGFSDATSNTLNQDTDPFTRYLASVQAVSYGGRTSSWTAFDDLDVTVPYVSRPRLSGTYVNTTNGSGGNRTLTTDITLNLTPPTFDTFSLTNELFRADNVAMNNRMLVASGSGFSYTDRANDRHPYPPNNETIPTYYYQVRTTFVPLGYPDGAANSPIEILSNVVGPNGDQNSGPMPEVW